MAAIEAAPESLDGLLAEVDVVIANVNAPLQTVVSGSRAAIEAAVAWCTERDVRARRLPVACAFHSSFVEPAQRRLAEMLRETQLASPRIPVYSNTTAGAVSGRSGGDRGDPRRAPDPAGRVLARGRGDVRRRRADLRRGRPAQRPDRARRPDPRRAPAPRDPRRPAGPRRASHSFFTALQRWPRKAWPSIPSGCSTVAPSSLLAREGLEPVGGRPPVPPALWLVDGGSARPANETAQQAPSAKQPAPADPQVDGMNMNPSDTNQGHVPRLDAGPARAAGPGRRSQRCAVR